MTNTTWIRIAAGLTLFLAAGHTVGAVLAGPSHGAGEVALRTAMREFRVTEMGMERSYWDFYLGSGWAITVLLLGAAAVLWFLAPLARAHAAALRPLVLSLALCFAGVTIVSACSS